MKKRLYILAIAIFMICNNVSAIYELASDTTGYIPSTDTTAVVPPAPEIPDTSDVIPPNVPDTGTVVPPSAEPSAPSIEGRKVVEYPHVVASGKKQQMSLSLEDNNLRVKGQIWAQGTKEHYLDYQIMADSAYISRVDMDYKNTKAYLLDIDVLIPGFAGDKYKVTFEALDVSLSATDEAKQRKTMLIERGNYAAQPEMENTFLVDGRTWNYKMQDMVIVDSVNLKTENVNRYFKLKIDGDTIFKDVNCKKIYYIENDNTSLYGYAYEDGLKVYFYFLKSMQNFCSQSNSWELFFDFGIKKDEVFCSDLAYMSDVDTIEVKGNRYVRYWIGPKKNDKIIKTYPIIHSIGGFGGLHDNTFVMVSGLPTYSCMSIYDGSKCVFEPSDYWVSPITTTDKKSAFLVEGRSWKYSKVMLSDKGDKIEEQFSITVGGDTLFDNRWCKSLIYTDGNDIKLAGYAYETDDRKVFVYNTLQMDNAIFLHEGWMCTNDFSLNIGESVTVCHADEDKYVVSSMDSITVKDASYIRWGVSREGYPNDTIFRIVEGIGNSKYGIYAYCPLDIDGYPLYYFDSCYQGDSCIFKASDYNLVSIDNKKSAFLVEGRSWKYYYYHRTYDADYIEKVKKCYYSLTIQGDTIISDRCCKKIYYKEDSIRYNTYDKNYNLTETHLVISDSISLHGFICEEKGSVSFYFLNKLIAAAYIDLGKWIKMYDFNAKSGEQCDWLIYEHGFSQLTKTQENINGIDYPCYLLYGENSQYGNVTVPVIPGIGCNGLYFTPIELSSSTFGGGFLSVYDGKKSIFKSSDYYRLFDKYNTKYAAVRLGSEPMESQFDYDQNHVSHLWVWGKPQAADYEYLRTKRLAELELLDMRDADIDTLQAEAFDITLPESNASPKYIVLPKKLKHISDNALCVYPNITTYEVTGAYPSLGKDVYSRKGKTSNHIFVVPSIDNKYLILHTIDPTGGSSGPGRVPIKRLAMVDNDSIYGSSVMSKGGDTLYYVNASKGNGYAVADGMKTIAANAMENKLLENAFNIPETVDSIGNRVFNGLRIVETRSNALQYYLACYRANPPMIGMEVFDESSLVTGSHVFYVNKESISDYKNTKGWDKLYYGDIDDVSGVEEVKTAEKQSPYYYDLQGRRLINPTKGLYIHNGKKVIVR